MVKMKARKIIKLIVAMFLGLAVLLGAFWGVIKVDEALKSHIDISTVEYDCESFLEEMKHNGSAYVNPNLYIEGTELTSNFFIQKFYYKTLPPMIKSTFTLSYWNTEYVNGENVFTPGCSNVGILNVSIIVESNPVRTLYEQLLWKQQLTKDYESCALRYDVLEEEILGTPTLAFVSITQGEFQTSFDVYAESKVSKDVLVTTRVSWLIDLDTYDYEFMTQQARDFVEFVIRNVEAPVD